ncbi:helix-loop-helix DNA-binding domain-containing protein [Hirsutella rhossiliensis]|uniref:Helix-loop-helix DNA-binding domain-containing protein n=1 Tax=Hirsutella rhossiliensis TaxID=111463 RepID=A0A9P8SFG9_9HYPO|nr:helix-loop-helix DNA-binding domain-containing protein [Hirsutella rhossiliensis]KAH0960918.1 helix-loop-helix DNA-binding domain-containing protein [Hirsutella rhossiliensis]
MSSSAAWHGHAGQHPAGGDDDDLNHFLDMADGMHFDLHAFHDAAPPQPSSFMARHQPDIVMPDAAHSQANLLGRHHTPVMTDASMMATPAPDASIPNIDAQIQYLQRQKLHQQQQQRQLHEQRSAFFHQSHSVPPTPQSLEMHPASSSFFSQPDHVPRHAVYDRGYHQRMTEQQDMAFTPLVSPAVTPLDPQFNVENAFAVAASYFSPLTSPALRAQHDAPSAYDQVAQFNDSPIDMDLEPPAMSGLAINQDLSKKARKSNAAAAKARGKASIKSSPIAKPQRRRTGPSPAIVSQLLSEVEGRNPWSGDQALLPMPAALADGPEENASVSPENLTDMPPPPIPNRRSTSKSPYIHPQNGTSQLLPPTPASLMKLPASRTKRPPATSPEQKTVTDMIESLELPEAVTSGPLAPVDSPFTSPAPSAEPGSAAKAPATQPLPSPGIKCLDGTAPGPSPQLQPGSSAPSAKKTPQLASRNRKRSTGSMHASPALLPRISPNIKPLLPGTPGLSAAEDTASRLLMSKSNYQNILEGNTVPGVSYPSELSTNLTSKRTSHKIAEQGRRNRINMALQVMAGLLPDQQEAEVGEEAERKDGGKLGNVPNSKASVVENAIVHMQKLQKENGDLKQQVQELKDQLKRIKESPTDS